MATHSSIPTCKIPLKEEPGVLIKSQTELSLDTDRNF